MVTSTSDQPLIAVAVDAAIFTVRADTTLVALVERGNDPYRGQMALPGGFVEAGEDLPEAAARELLEETGLVVPVRSLNQLAAYGAPGRDPRMRVVSIVYWAMIADLADPVGGSDAASSYLVPLDEALTSDDLAFDHGQILIDAWRAAEE